MNFKLALEKLKSEVEGTVRVASIYSVGLSEMSQLEEEFSRRYPQARLEVEYLRPGESVRGRGYRSRRSGSDELSGSHQGSHGAAVARRKRWWWRPRPIMRWREKSEVQPEDLEGLDFVGFDEDLPIRRDIDRFLREHHVHVNVTLHFDNLQMIKEAVAHGVGRQHHAGAHHGRRNRAGPAGADSDCEAGAIPAGRDCASAEEAVSSRRAGVSGFVAGAAGGLDGGADGDVRAAARSARMIPVATVRESVPGGRRFRQPRR